VDAHLAKTDTYHLALSGRLTVTPSCEDIHVSESEPRTLIEAIRYFSDPDRAFRFVLDLRWPNGSVRCPRCDHDEVSFVSTRRIWKCKGCRKQFSLKVGTIFEDSPLGWDKWLPAVWLIANSKNSISSHELARMP